MSLQNYGEKFETNAINVDDKQMAEDITDKCHGESDTNECQDNGLYSTSTIILVEEDDKFQPEPQAKCPQLLANISSEGEIIRSIDIMTFIPRYLQGGFFDSPYLKCFDINSAISSPFSFSAIVIVSST